MKLIHTQSEPPWPYEASKVLNHLRHPVTGPEFIARVRRFSRIGLLTLGTRFLWHTWNHDETIKASTLDAIGHRITMAYAERVMMLAATFGNDHNRPGPSEVEFRLLCWELHNASDGGIVDLLSADELVSRLTAIDSDSPLRRVTREHARTLLVEAFKARIAALQHVGRYFDRSHFARGYLIAQALAARASALGGAEYVRAERQYLLSSVEGYFRAAWALFCKAWTGLTIAAGDGQPPITEYGHVYAKDWPEDPNLEKVDLTADRMRAVANVLSEPLSSFANYRATYQDADATTLKYDAAFDRLLIRPMIDFSLKPNADRILKGTSAAVEAWRRAAEAISQASGLLRQHGSLLKERYGTRGPVVLAIVTNDQFVDESIGFRAVAKAGELLAGTGVDAIVMLNVDELERWLLLGTVDELARQAIESWSKLDPTSLSQEGRIEAPKPKSDLPHIAAGWKSLFPFYEIQPEKTSG
jgi:hypothetical protein